MDTTARPVCLFLALALAACSDGVDTASRPTTFDGEVLRVSFERDDGGKETFSTLRDEWYGWPWFPIMPDQSGRRWTMLKTDREGVPGVLRGSWRSTSGTAALRAAERQRCGGGCS